MLGGDQMKSVEWCFFIFFFFFQKIKLWQKNVGIQRKMIKRNRFDCTDLERWIEHDDITRWLDPWFAINLNRNIRVGMNFNVTTLWIIDHVEACMSSVSFDCIQFTCAIRIADRRPDWICPKCTTPVTPTTSSIPSQWFGLVNWSSFSGPHGFAPDPQLYEKNYLTLKLWRNELWWNRLTLGYWG